MVKEGFAVNFYPVSSCDLKQQQQIVAGHFAKQVFKITMEVLMKEHLTRDQPFFKTFF